MATFDPELHPRGGNADNVGEFSERKRTAPSSALEQAGGDMDGFELYETEDGSIQLSIRTDGESVWATQQQIADLFGTTKQNVSQHLSSIFDDDELDPEATVKDFFTVRREGNRTVQRSVIHYNLDAILSVGYRVKSKTATQFRRWSTDVLRRFLTDGVVQNQARLAEIGRMVEILQRSDDEQVAGIAEIIGRYAGDIDLLDAYDHGTFGDLAGSTPVWAIEYDDARNVIAELAARYPNDSLLGIERGAGLAGILGQIEQSFGGEALYPTVQERAANLLYMVVKNHPLADGNKRTAAALFVRYLSQNQALHDAGGRELVTGNGLAATTLMVAMSKPEEKPQMITLVRSMLQP